MNALQEIEINTFQLNILLDKTDKNGFDYLLNNGVYCSNCNSICSKVEKNYNICLTKLNDIKIEGKCAKCKTKVVRIMEFGENENFYKRAINLRKSIQQ